MAKIKATLQLEAGASRFGHVTIETEFDTTVDDTEQIAEECLAFVTEIKNGEFNERSQMQ